MPNVNLAFSQQGEMMFEGIINGQSENILYDPLKQAALVPDLRNGEDGKPSITMPFPSMGFEGLLSQIQSEICGSATRTVRASEFYWAEYDQAESMAFSISGGSGSTPGNSVVSQISRLSQSSNGTFTKPIAGFDAILFGTTRQIVRITNVTQVSAGVFNITIKAQNNQIIDLRSKSKWKLVLMPMRTVPKGILTDIETRAFAYQPPILYKSGMQLYEDGIGLHNDEIINYVYDRRWEMAKGIDSRGNMVDQIYMPAITDQFTKNWAAHRIFRMLFNTKDNTVNEGGFDGIMPTIEKYGMFNMAYSALLRESFRDVLFGIIKNLRKVNGSNLLTMLYDFNFELDWSESMNALVKGYDAGVQYKSFGDGGVGLRALKYFEFNTFEYNSYKFAGKRIDAMDDPKTGQMLKDTCIVLPGTKFTDNNGRVVPIITTVKLEGAEPAKTQYIWFDNTRVRGGRTLNGYINDSFGMEFHAPTRCGILRGGDN